MSKLDIYSEKHLLQQIAAGNEAAFRQLFEEYREKLFNYLVRITKSREATEEIVIDIFMKLWIGKELTGNIENIDAFLYKVAFNKAMDFLKMSARHTGLQKLVAREIENNMTFPADYKLLDEDYRRILEDAVKLLSPQRRLVFTMSREKGLSHEDIARQLNLSRNTVKNHTTEALKFIRSFLLKNGIPIIIVFGVV